MSKRLRRDVKQEYVNPKESLDASMVDLEAEFTTNEVCVGDRETKGNAFPSPTLKFFSSQIIIVMARKICDFNHISPELNREQIDELIGYYKTTHQKWFLYKKAHRHYKLIKYAARLTSGTIAGGGIASVILSGSVLTIISLGASLLIEIILDYKNVNENMNNCKYAYQSYQHLMIQIKTALRLGQYNIQNLVNSIANLDNFFVDICPLVDKYKKDYYIKYIDS